MPTIRQSIKDNIATALRTITTDQGYPLTVKAVECIPPPDFRKVSVLPALYVISSSSTLIAREYSSRVMRDECYAVVGYVKDDSLEVLVGCIEKALSADTRRGNGNCVASWISDMTLEEVVSGDTDIFSIEIHAQVNRPYGSP